MNTILAMHVTTKNTTNVWAVFIEGQNELSYCKSAYKAMKLMFLLKTRTGAQISENCLQRLSQEIARQKAEIAAPIKAKIEEVANDFAESHSVDAVLEKPKKVRKTRTRKPKVAETAA